MLVQSPSSTAGNGGGFDFSSLIGGGSAASTGSGYDFSTLLNGAGGASGGLDGNGISTLVGGGIGAAAGTFFGSPQLGAQLGTMLGGMFGGHETGSGKGLFNGLHSTTLQPLDDTKFKQGDAQLYAWMARQNGISVEEVAAVMAYDGATTGHGAQDVFDSYASQGTSGNGANNLAGWISRFNSARKALIVSGSLGPTALTVSALPALANYGGQAQLISLSVGAASNGAEYTQGGIGTAHDFAADYPQGGIGTALVTFDGAQAGAGNNLLAGAPTGAAALTGQDAGKIVKGVFDGAVKGGTDAWTGTADGRKFKLDYIKDWAKDNQLLAVGIAGLLGLGGVSLVKMIKGNHKTSS